jgi:hypothetical protein
MPEDKLMDLRPFFNTAATEYGYIKESQKKCLYYTHGYFEYLHSYATVTYAHDARYLKNSNAVYANLPKM